MTVKYKYMRFSEDSYRFNSDLLSEQIQSELKDKTFFKTKLVMVTTSKDFIGTVSEKEFSIIDSFFPIGSACVIHGEIGSDSVIALRTSLHKAFRMIFLVWLIGFSVAFLVLGITMLSVREFLQYCIMLIVVAPIFRLFIHGVYVIARNHALEKLRGILKLRPA